MTLSLSRVLCAIACVLFLVGALGRFIGITGEPQTLLFWGLAFFSAGHVL